MLLPRGTIAIAGLTVIALLGIPRTASADFIDWILDLSGPQMTGVVVFDCKIYFDGSEPECDGLYQLIKEKKLSLLKAFDKGHVRVTIESAIYSSTGKNSQGHNYKTFQIQMAAFEPMLEIGSWHPGAFSFYHGAGVSLFRLGRHFNKFNNVGLKFRPVGFTIGRRVDVGINVRWFPDGFGADEFGFETRPANTDRKNERLYGLSAGFGW